MLFHNTDSATHSVAFTNGRCSLTLSPGEQAGPGNELGPDNPDCKDNFMLFVGSYGYTVDGKFPGTVETVPAYRSVSLKARTHKVRRGERLTLHGRVMWDNSCCEFATKAPFPVIVLARYAGSRMFKPIATVVMGGRPDTHDFWHLKVRPGQVTTYIAEVNGQLAGGQIWKRARSRPFTVRMRRY